jgi:AbrB family looped-hinge helix DNA binding protein
MRTFTATVTSKGQMTIPVEVRRYLGLNESDKVIVSISDEGVVEIRRSRYPDIRSLRGIAGSLDGALPWNDVIRIAREDALLPGVDDDRE